ncbi:hypothetical protein CYLTODRAFT_213932 [Cylindrobasidium torrendii FP15055 ss-10]|uniref:Uncharacterized protein n=1 Tax=Cylindrobasidium torrendii FP15055 ss-10 TaxID=1314674 RepID=A0A0D7BGV2_9AGAR|nr:hypothetical protein CYLTODRAFT_213932 [Cylindrobasidium torrendii FP15055 ss-10]
MYITPVSGVRFAAPPPHHSQCSVVISKALRKAVQAVSLALKVPFDSILMGVIALGHRIELIIELYSYHNNDFTRIARYNFKDLDKDRLVSVYRFLYTEILPNFSTEPGSNFLLGLSLFFGVLLVYSSVIYNLIILDKHSRGSWTDIACGHLVPTSWI